MGQREGGEEKRGWGVGGRVNNRNTIQNAAEKIKESILSIRLKKAMNLPIYFFDEPTSAVALQCIRLFLCC